ncbi:MAG: AAA family ATPase, partial [Prevotella sp.]|nr:AAA family ATPase [Prevotella sp.]
MVNYPIGIQTFETIRSNDYLYVDKTKYIYEVTHPGHYVFLSRPRRFGKSLLTSTFDAYFSGRKDLFKGLAIEKLEKEWKQYPVLHFSLASAKLGTIDDLYVQLRIQLERNEKRHGIHTDITNISERFQKLVTSLYEKTGTQVVVLIDEYDAPLLTVLHDHDRLEQMRMELQSFYSPLKDLDPYLRFVFITGITKFSQLSIFSQFNNLNNISMLPQYAAMCGITIKELEDNFQEGIGVLAEKYQYSHQQVIDKLLYHYDGYHFSEDSEGVLNPFSLLSAMNNRKFDHYWFSTGTPTFLVNMLKHFHADITKIDGSEVWASDFDQPTENMQSILPL